MITKKCPKCKNEKSIDNFCKNKSRKDGYDIWCKECNLLNNQKWRKNNKSHVVEHSHNYYINNIETIHKKNKIYYHRNREDLIMQSRKYQKDNAIKVKDNHLKYDYGISIDEYEKLLSNQNGVCAICGKEETDHLHGKTKYLAVDHDHNDKTIRGLLCSKCNKAIGLFYDDPNIIRKAAIYLESR